MGKSALLADTSARAEASGGHVLCARGIESEMELPFGALHQLVYGLAPLLDAIPAAQAAALKAALALAPADGVDRFAVYAAALAVLSVTAAAKPVVAIVDDAHWLDEASSQAVAFVARRVSHEPVVMLISTRTEEPTAFRGEGIEVVELEPLTQAESLAVLAAERPSLEPSAARAVVRSSRGNPLALLEFAAALDDGEAPPPLDEPLPVRDEVQRAFARRVVRLSPGGRRALLLTAAGGPSGSGAIWSALASEGVGDEAVAEAQRERLLLAGRELKFCHPLARSAIYHVATPAELRAAHAALAEATDDPIARAWHLAEAANGADSAVADALERAADEARKRGGAWVEASALERSARLTPEVGLRAKRLFRAAVAAEAAGHAKHAERLLGEVVETTTNDDLRYDAVARRSYLLFDRGEFDAALRIANEAANAAPPEAAAHVLSASGVVHALMHRLAISEAREVAENALQLAGNAGRDDPDLRHMVAWTRELSGDTADAITLARESIAGIDLRDVVAIDLAAHFVYLEDYEMARELLERIVAHLRRAAAFGNLAYALDHLANLDLRTGRPLAAYSHAVEAVELMASMGIAVGVAASLARRALIEALLGRSAEARAHGREALDVALERGDRWNEIRARAALGCEALSRGDAAAAAEVLRRAVCMLDAGGVRHPNAFRVHGDLVEALTRMGDLEEAEKTLSGFARDAERTESPWALAVAARCKAMLTDDAGCDRAFAAAVRAVGRVDGFEHGRTLLAYGERLRRLRHVRETRAQLRLALEAFERLPAPPWVERARAELRASGERLRPRGRVAHEDLTPQELQIAVAAGEGLTNKEIAARLFLSPKTVEFHLTRVYRKLAVRSRAELAGVLRTSGGLPDRLSA
jgi:DNA-binding CsgD family transcriptional regulator